MTRINLVPVQELMDQHLMAEYREIPMVPSALKRSMRTKSVDDILGRIPVEFTLNKGHVLFFYDKLKYLQRRYRQLQEELTRRGFALNKDRLLMDVEFPSVFHNDYEPTPAAYDIIRTRIAEKIALKPSWYRYTKQ